LGELLAHPRHDAAGRGERRAGAGAGRVERAVPSHGGRRDQRGRRWVLRHCPRRRGRRRPLGSPARPRWRPIPRTSVPCSQTWASRSPIGWHRPTTARRSGAYATSRL